VLLSAHLGAFEFVGHALTARGYPVTSVTGRTTSRFLFDAVTHLRASRGMRLVEATPGGVRRVIQALRRGECVAFLVDYDFFQNGRPVRFFGRETTLPPGPIRIARDTGALVVGTFARRTADGYALSLAEPFEVEKSGDLEADLARGMERAVAVLERAIGATPDQWLMFQRVWPSAAAVPVRVFPVGSPLESELLRRVDAVLPEPRLGGTRAAPADPPAAPPPADAPTGRTAPPP
jgi:KDO2-lipid IV(A) lauroyltransferase